VKPGDLVVLKDRDLYVGLDIGAKRYFAVPSDSVGIFLKRAIEVGENGYEFSDDYILTHGRVLVCRPGDWSVTDESDV